MKKRTEKPYRVFERTMSDGSKTFRCEFHVKDDSGVDYWSLIGVGIKSLKEAKQCIEKHKFENSYTEKVHYFN